MILRDHQNERKSHWEPGWRLSQVVTVVLSDISTAILRRTIRKPQILADECGSDLRYLRNLRPYLVYLNGENLPTTNFVIGSVTVPGV